MSQHELPRPYMHMIIGQASGHTTSAAVYLLDNLCCPSAKNIKCAMLHINISF